MATKSAAQRAAEAVLMALTPAQGELLPDGRQRGVVYTGKPGRPRGRQNNATLAKQANIAALGDKALRDTLKTAVGEAVAEARRIVCDIWLLPYDTKPDHVVTRKLEKTGENGMEIYRAVMLGELIEEMVPKCMDAQKNARAIAMPFVQQKKPQAIDVTERKVIEIRQTRMDDDGLDPALLAKNVTPPKADQGEEP